MLGEYREANFDYGSGTEIYWSCPIEFQNEFFVFGGTYNKRQVTLLNRAYFVN